MKRSVSLVVVLFVFSITALADVPRPEKTPKNNSQKTIETTMMIHLKADAKEAVLVIPKNRIRQLRAQLDELDGESNTAEATSAGGITGTQTIVSGTFLSLALVFGGIWFMRSGKSATKAGKTLAILTVLTCAGCAAAFVFANAGPPPEARSITGKMFSSAVHLYGFGSGRVRLETSNDAENIDLIVPDPKSSSDGGE